MNRNTWKRLFVVLLVALLCIQLAPVAAYAAVPQYLYGTWEGTYIGSSSGTYIERQLRLDIDYVSEGRFEGYATIDGGSSGRYYLVGQINADASIQFQGVEWIDNPKDFSFNSFHGFYDETSVQIRGTVNNTDDRAFVLTKTSYSCSSMRVSIDSIPREWDGEYDGSHDSTVVRRIYEIHIQSISESGDIRGVAIFAPSEKADAAYGANGSYYFSGTIDFRFGKISLQGYEWIDYPENFEYSNWSFVALSGFLDLSSGAAIHGKSRNGIWEMTAINYEAIQVLSGFTLGRDNNNYVHSSSRTWDGAGFVGVTDYTIDSAYFQKLTRNSSAGETRRLKKKMHNKWKGSCYGIAMSMGLLYEGYIRIDDLTNALGKDSYYSLDYPCNDRKFLNMVNYYQLSQGLENGGKTSAAVSFSCNNGLCSGLVNWVKGYDSLTVFLKKLVNHCSSNHVELLGFSTKESGHAILITGCSFDMASDTYQLQLYDENCIDDPYSLGEFRYMTVAKDFSSFTFTDANGELVNNDTYQTIYFLDWSSLGSVVSGTSSDYSDHTRISFQVKQPIRIENESGQYLMYDGSSFSGDIPIYGIETVDTDQAPWIVIETANAEKLTITNMGTEICFEAFSDTDYLAFSGTGIDAAVLDMDSGLKLEGSDYQFEASIATEGTMPGDPGLISLSASASADLELQAVGTGVAFYSEAEPMNVCTASYIGVEKTEKQYTEVGNSFVIQGDATIDGAVELTVPEAQSYFRVSFVTNGGSMVPEQEVSFGSQAARPDPPAREGYLFICWELNGEEYDFSSPVTGDLNLTARWQEVGHPSQFEQSSGQRTKAGLSLLEILLLFALVFTAVVLITCIVILAKRRSSR